MCLAAGAVLSLGDGPCGKMEFRVRNNTNCNKYFLAVIVYLSSLFDIALDPVITSNFKQVCKSFSPVSPVLFD